MATIPIASNAADGFSVETNEYITYTDGPFGSAYIGFNVAGTSDNDDMGLIFRSTGVPQGATILTCTITCRTLTTDYAATPTGDWWGFAVDSPSDFDAAHTHRISDHHTRTSASVSDNWPNEDPHVSPSLVTIAQEIVNRAGFAGDLGFTWRNTGSTLSWSNVWDYSADVGSVAVLTITWASGAIFDEPSHVVIPVWV